MIINRPYDLKPLRKQFFCPLKPLRKHATVAFGKEIPFVLIFKGLHMSLWVPLFLVKAELRFDIAKANLVFLVSVIFYHTWNSKRRIYKGFYQKGKQRNHSFWSFFHNTRPFFSSCNLFPLWPSKVKDIHF